jgi:hypothetical protein
MEASQQKESYMPEPEVPGEGNIPPGQLPPGKKPLAEMTDTELADYKAELEAELAAVNVEIALRYE